MVHIWESRGKTENMLRQVYGKVRERSRSIPLTAPTSPGLHLTPQLRSPKMESQIFCQQNVRRQIGWISALSLPHGPTHTNSLSSIPSPPSLPTQTTFLILPLSLPKTPCLLCPFESYPSMNTQIQCHFPQEVFSALPSPGELLPSERPCTSHGEHSHSLAVFILPGLDCGRSEAGESRQATCSPTSWV